MLLQPLCIQGIAHLPRIPNAYRSMGVRGVQSGKINRFKRVSVLFYCLERVSGQNFKWLNCPWLHQDEIMK